MFVHGTGIHNLTRADEMYAMGNFRFWFNPSRDAINTVKELTHLRHRRVHIFLFSTMCLKPYLGEFIGEFYKDISGVPSMTIHIPKNMEDMAVVVRNIIDNEWRRNEWNESRELFHPRISIVCERHGCSFRSPYQSRPYYLTVRYEKDRAFISMDINNLQYFGYDPNFRKFGGKPGAVKNYVQATYPDLFRDKIIAGFKESCPPGILNTFKTEEEIWDYIVQNGEWKIKEN